MWWFGAPLVHDGVSSTGAAFAYLGTATGLEVTPVWTATGEPFSLFGASVAGAGDVNGDGFDDVLVGASQFSTTGLYEGRAALFLGSATGLDGSPAWNADGYQSYENFGSSVAGAGDVNGDGYDDVVVGARYYDGGQGFGEGRAVLYLGSASGLSPTEAWMAESDKANAYFGHSVASAGDINADGYGDVLVGAHGFDNDQNSNDGRAYVYLGGPAGLSETPSWTAELGDGGQGMFGYAVASAGDVNGDGFGDVAVGAPDNSSCFYICRVSVYQGSASGLSTLAALTISKSYTSDGFGNSVSPAGDVNGDGFGDLVVGATGSGSTGANAFVYLGASTGLATSPAWTVQSTQTSAAGAISVASAGDVTGDGYGDVIVGMAGEDTNWNGWNYSSSDSGRAYLYLGSADFCYEDLDGDAYGSTVQIPATSTYCTNPGESAFDTDCDDSDAANNPGSMYEIPGDSIDQYCDGVDSCYRDSDHDG